MINLIATGDSQTSLPKKGKLLEGEKKTKDLRFELDEKDIKSILAVTADFLSRKFKFLKYPSPLIFQEEIAQNLKLANRLL